MAILGNATIKNGSWNHSTVVADGVEGARSDNKTTILPPYTTIYGWKRTA